MTYSAFVGNLKSSLWMKVPCGQSIGANCFWKSANNLFLANVAIPFDEPLEIIDGDQ
jgi:hypothetical protein